jgi:hypothetical protein
MQPAAVKLYEVELILMGRVSVATEPEQVIEKRSQLMTHPTIDRLTIHWATLAPITRILAPSNCTASSISEFRCTRSGINRSRCTK